MDKITEIRERYQREKGIPSHKDALNYADYLEEYIVNNCVAPPVSKSIEPVRVITGCELGFRYDKCDRFKATNSCRHCPFSI